jgi:periplasmic copper chaperone A
MNLRITLAAVVAALVVPGAAWAHITLHPNSLPAGGFTVVDLDVPNELGGPATTRVAVKFPPGFADVSTQAIPGWKSTVKYRKAANPIVVEGEKHTTEVDQVIWTSSTGIRKGQFMQFPLSLATPDHAGTTLTFKALQTYSNGKVVRWIGSPGSDAPAPQVLLRSHDAPAQDFPAGVSAARKTSSASTVAAGFVAVLGLGGLALYRRRR